MGEDVISVILESVGVRKTRKFKLCSIQCLPRRRNCSSQEISKFSFVWVIQLKIIRFHCVIDASAVNYAEAVYLPHSDFNIELNTFVVKSTELPNKKITLPPLELMLAHPPLSFLIVAQCKTYINILNNISTIYRRRKNQKVSVNTNICAYFYGADLKLFFAVVKD